MTYKILFSIAVHEKMEVVFDMLDNIRYYAPNSAVVLHVARDFRDEFFRYSLDLYTNVYVNPQSLITGFSDQTLFFVHYSNLVYAESKGLEYEKWSMFASNQLLVREGLESHLEQFESSGYKEKLEFDVHRYRFNQDSQTKQVVADFGFSIRKQPPEGTFYSRADVLFALDNKKMKAFFSNNLKYFIDSRFAKKRAWVSKRGKKLVRKKFGFAVRIFPNIFKRFIFASEEVIFPSIMGRSDQNIGPIYCFLDWDNNLEVSVADVNLLLSGEAPELFAVKRVDRLIDNPLREYIRGLSNNYG